MPVEFVDFEEARQRDGLRMVVVSGVPSPWGEAAKGLYGERAANGVIIITTKQGEPAEHTHVDVELEPVVERF